MLNKSNRRQCLMHIASLLTLAPALTSTIAQAIEPAYPLRPITLIVPWPAGGSTDISLRFLAEEAGRRLGQTVVVENRPGAGGSMAMPLLQTAKPDGYTLAQMPQPVFHIGHRQKVLWDPIRDTMPIIQISGYTFGVVVPVASPFQSMADILKWGRANPGQLTVGSNGIGTTPHTAMEELMEQQGIVYVHVPYKGTTEQMLAVSSGQLMVGVNSTGFAPYVETGKLRLLATFGERRSKRWPETPTMKELGLGIVAMSTYGIVGPKGLSPQVVQTLHAAFKAAMNEPIHRDEIAKYDQELNYLGPEDYGKFMRETFATEKRAVDRLVQLRRSN